MGAAGRRYSIRPNVLGARWAPAERRDPVHEHPRVPEPTHLGRGERDDDVAVAAEARLALVDDLGTRRAFGEDALHRERAGAAVSAYNVHATWNATVGSDLCCEREDAGYEDEEGSHGAHHW